MSQYTWVVMGEASRLPVAVFDRKYHLKWWLGTRNGVSLLRVFRFSGNVNVVELDIDQLLQEGS